jgi:hypothetical protein
LESAFILAPSTGKSIAHITQTRHYAERFAGDCPESSARNLMTLSSSLAQRWSGCSTDINAAQRLLPRSARNPLKHRDRNTTEISAMMTMMNSDGIQPPATDKTLCS